MKKYFSLLLMSLTFLGSLGDMVNNSAFSLISKKKKRKKNLRKNKKNRKNLRRFRKNRVKRKSRGKHSRGMKKPSSSSSVSNANPLIPTINPTSNVPNPSAPSVNPPQSTPNNSPQKTVLTKQDIEKAMTNLVQKIQYNDSDEGKFYDSYLQGIVTLITNINNQQGEIVFKTSLLRPFDQSSDELKKLKDAIGKNYSNNEEFYSNFADYMIKHPENYKNLNYQYKPTDKNVFDNNGGVMRGAEIWPTTKEIKNRLMGLLKWILTGENYEQKSYADMAKEDLLS